MKGDAEARLRYYADRFPMVEVNASFYALPTVETTASWAERTPPGFRFHVKAHQLISGHPSEPGRLPPPLRDLPASYDAKGRIRRPSRELRDAIIDSLLEAVGPLGDKLGAILVQLPPYVVSGDRQRAELSRILERLRPARAAVEFRHRSWAEPGEREAAAELLGAHDASWVVVDAPRIDAKNVMPPIVEVTTPSLAYLRLHGRNAATWNTGRTVAERFDHVYTDAGDGGVARPGARHGRAGPGGRRRLQQQRPRPRAAQRGGVRGADLRREATGVRLAQRLRSPASCTPGRRTSR